MSGIEPFQTDVDRDPLLPGSSTKKFSFLKLIILSVALLIIIAIIVIVVVSISNSKKNYSEDGKNNPSFSFSYQEEEGPLGNPLKGFAPWATSSDLHVPCSLEFLQVKMIRICETEGVIDLSYVEKQLQKIASRNRTAIVRFVIDDPGSEAAPAWFLEKAKTHSYTRKDETYVSVDYNDEYVLKYLENILKEFGKRYDGDPRIAFWQLGTYGHWGEWHETYVEKSLKASEDSKDRMMNMNLNNFKKTMCQVRRPEERSKIREIGFYHDMFGNYEHGRSMDKFFNETDTWDRWMTHSFGGEEDPDLQKTMFGEPELIKQFNIDLEKYHPTYLFDSSFYKVYEDVIVKYPNWMKERSKVERLMGYNYYVERGKVILNKKNEENKLDINIELYVKNKGKAPFYYDWMVNFALVNFKENGEVSSIKEEISNVSIKGILPEEEKKWEYVIKDLEANLTNFSLALRIPSKVNSFVRLANKEQLEDNKGGWFIIANKDELFE